LISGKYSHAACFPLQVAFTDERGQRHHAVSAMVTNFTKPTSQKPSLLKFKEVFSKKIICDFVFRKNEYEDEYEYERDFLFC
jgi:hypothetical protein